MKKLLLVLIVLGTAGSVFAAELKVTGDMMMRGNRESNIALTEGTEVVNSYFDYDLNLNLAFVANENATVFTKLTFDKAVTDNNNSYSGKVAMGDTTYTGPTATTGTDDGNAVLNVERAYLNYKFHPALQLNTGLMGGGQWASTFGDTEINVTRVQFIGALSADMVFIATYEKQDEKGTIANVSSDKDDTTVYYLASRMKFGPLTVLPLVAYGTKGWGYQGGLETAFAGLNAAGFSKKKYDQTVMSGTLGLNGDFGMIGFESEFQYKVIDSDGLDDDATKNSAAFTGAVGAGTTAALQALDSTTYGAYVNLFAKVDPAKVGFVFAYASADEKDGVYNWGEDFDVCVVMDDYIAQGSANLMGWSVYKLYADVTMGAIGVNAAVAYGATNKDYVATADKDATFTEIDLGASYAFDANATYSISAGYAMTKDVLAGKEADAYVLSHKMSIKF